MRSCLAAFALTLVACTPSEDTDAMASFSLMEVPTDVSCLQVLFAGPTRSTERKLMVMPGEPSEYLLRGLPAGMVTVEALAFPVSCDEIEMEPTPTWVGDPSAWLLYPGTINPIVVTLRRAASSDVGFDFVEDCGDLYVGLGEECDDGNLVDGDGCSSSCALEGLCGNGATDAGEECDDGNVVSGDGCSSACQTEPICGDGIVQGAEQCDDGGPTATCTSACTLCALADPTCDLIDDDCDGAYDDDFVGPILGYCGIGACRSTAGEVCVFGAVIVFECVPGLPIGPDTTCDTIDDDCDGAIDESCVP